jgi:hypothetical protein
VVELPLQAACSLPAAAVVVVVVVVAVVSFV